MLTTNADKEAKSSPQTIKIITSAVKDVWTVRAISIDSSIFVKRFFSFSFQLADNGDVWRTTEGLHGHQTHSGHNQTSTYRVQSNPSPQSVQAPPGPPRGPPGKLWSFPLSVWLADGVGLESVRSHSPPNSTWHSVQIGLGY